MTSPPIHFRAATRYNNLRDVAQAVCGGACIIYPTETVYALGGSIFQEEAIRRIFDIKKRQDDKPVPIVLGDFEQLALITRWSSTALYAVAKRFWPGPLSVLIPVDVKLPLGVCSKDGYCAVRIPANTVARYLCRASRAPLVATSANISGHSSASIPSDVDSHVAKNVDHFIREQPWPNGGAPSTIIKLHEKMTFSVIRHGAISLQSLLEVGLVLRQI